MVTLTQPLALYAEAFARCFSSSSAPAAHLGFVPFDVHNARKIAHPYFILVVYQMLNKNKLPASAKWNVLWVARWIRKRGD